MQPALKNFTGAYLGINWGYCYVLPDRRNKKFRAGWNRKFPTGRLYHLCVQKYPHCPIASLQRWGFGVGRAGGTASSFGIPRKLSRGVKLRFSIAIYGALRFVIAAANQAGAALIAPRILLDLSRVLLYCDRRSRRNLVVYTKTFLQRIVLV